MNCAVTSACVRLCYVTWVERGLRGSLLQEWILYGRFSILAALSRQILFLFTMLTCLLAKMGVISNKMQPPQKILAQFHIWCSIFNKKTVYKIITDFLNQLYRIFVNAHQICSATQNVPVFKIMAWETFPGERGRTSSDLGDVLSGGIQCRGTQGHLGEDVGRGDPPAKDISTVRRLFALILFIEGKTRTNINMAFISVPSRWTNLPGIPPHTGLSTGERRDLHWNERRATLSGVRLPLKRHRKGGVSPATPFTMQTLTPPLPRSRSRLGNKGRCCPDRAAPGCLPGRGGEGCCPSQCSLATLYTGKWLLAIRGAVKGQRNNSQSFLLCKQLQNKPNYQQPQISSSLMACFKV